MKKLTLYILAIIFLPMFMGAQPLKKAKKAMNKYDYTQAVSILKKAVDKDKYQQAAVPLLAECYRMQHDIFNTRAWYARSVAMADAKPEAFLYYGQALQASGDYALARDMFRKYAGLSSDGKGEMFTIHCDSVLGPWKNMLPRYEVKTVSNINTDQSDFGPAFHEGNMVFASDFVKPSSRTKQYGWTGRGYLDIMKSAPVTPGDYWDKMKTPMVFNTLFNQEYHDGPACFSKDGNTIFLTRSYKDKAKKKDGFKTNLLKIFYATKTDKGWGEVKPFFLNSPEYSVGHPALSPDGQTLYFASDMPGGEGGTDIWMCKLDGDQWSSPMNLGITINTPEDEMFPYVKDDGSLYFSSAGHPGYGALDVFMSRNNYGKWTTPLNLHSPINGSFDDFALAFAPEAKNGFFSSNRTGGKGNDDIYAFRIAEVPEVIAAEPKKPAFISGVVKDELTLIPIAGATVFVYNQKTDQVLVLKTGSDGVYKTQVENPSEYTVKAMKPSYIADCMPFSLTEIKPGTTTQAPRDLMLSKLELNRVFKIDNIYYDFDKFNIRADAKPELDKLVAILMENAINVELGSHTDSRGSFAYNDHLSQNRAASAVEYIVSRGINQSRITAKGYGERQLTNNCSDGVRCSPEAHQANRRTEFKVTSYNDEAQNKDQFSPDQYKEGQVLTLDALPIDFFSQCGDKKVKSTQPVQQQAITQLVTQQPEKTVKPAIIPTKPEVAVKIVSPETVNTTNTGMYTIQFATGSLSPEIAKNIPDIMSHKGSDGITRYYVGQFKTTQAAKALKSEMIRMGFKDAWTAKMDEMRPLKTSR